MSAGWRQVVSPGQLRPGGAGHCRKRQHPQREDLAAPRGAPGLIRVDDSPEFVSNVLDHSIYELGVTLDFSRPGKPTDNGFIESFNGRLPDGATHASYPGHALVLVARGRQEQDRTLEEGL